MRLILCGFVAGCWLVQQMAGLPPAFACVVAGLVAFSLLLLAFSPERGSHDRRRAVAMHALCAVLALAVGASWAAWRAQRRLQDWLAPGQEGITLPVVGMVRGLPSRSVQGARFMLAVERPSPSAPLPGRLLLSWQQAPSDLLPGQRLALKVRLKRPHGLANPHGFDYEYWLLERGVGATGYVVDARPLPAAPLPWSVRIDRMRARLRERMLAAMPADAPFAGVLVALTIGDQSGIAPADWRVFTRTGIGHLVSISGLHITMISGLAAALARLAWRHSCGAGRWLRRPLPLRCPASKAGVLVSALAAFAYASLAGMEIPAQRTVAMVAVAALGLWCARTPPPSLLLAWAAAVALAIDPWAVCSAGFWLSYGAVAAIFLGASRPRPDDREAEGEKQRTLLHRACRAISRHLRDGARVQWAVTVGLVAPTLILFQQLSVVSPLANALAIPLVSFAITPAALLAATVASLPDLMPWLPSQPLAASLLAFAHGVLAWLVGLLAIIAKPSWAVWETAYPGTLACLLAIPGTLALLLPAASGWRWRVPGLLLLAPVLGASRASLPQGALRVTALDVGQGTAVVVETRTHRLLYDTGPLYGPIGAAVSSAGERVVLPYLRAMGIRELDAMVISHEDADHAGGARDVALNLPVTQLWSSVPANHPLLAWPPERAGPVRAPCTAGRQWTWDGVRFEFLHPLAEDAGNPAIGSNTRSCVLRVAGNVLSVMLAGDIDRQAEAALLRRYGPAALAADVLIVPHHGSRTSSSAEWLAAVRPRIAVFQMSYRNRYRHPNPRVWERYGTLGIARFRSDTAGAVTVTEEKGAAVARAYRREARRYWREAAGEG